MAELEVRRAGEAEVAACLALLPEAAGLPVEMLVARLGGRLAGAAAVVWGGWSDPTGFPLAVQVAPGVRRRGVGRALVQAARALTAGETGGLWSLRAAPPQGEAALFLQACGFEPRRLQHHFTAEVDDLLRVLAPLVARLSARRGAMPAATALADAPVEPVAALVAAEFGGAPVRAVHGLRRRAAAADPTDSSFAILVEGEVAGVLLSRTQDDAYVVEARVVAPPFRNGWVNLALLQLGLERARAAGLERFRFHCDDDVKDTLSLARRCGAERVSSQVLFYAASAAA